MHLLDPGDPAVALDRDITAAFGMANPVVWIVEARDASGIWTPEALARTHALTREVLRIPGVIATDVIGLASPNMRDLRVSDAGLQPVYLMGRAPATEEAVQALRARVEGDPMLAGQLVDRDGRATMVVGNFRPDADPAAVARAALALRDRFQDERVQVWVTGAPILAALAPGAFRSVALPAAMALAVLLLAVPAFGGRRGVQALLAALAAALAAATALYWTGLLVLPWAAFGVLVAMVAAAAAVRAPSPTQLFSVGLGLVLASAAAALVATAPERTLWSGLALATLAGLAAGVLARMTSAPAGRVHAKPSSPRLRRAGWIAILAAVALGAVRLEPGFALASYGTRWLPAAAAADLRALERLFPPPASLALRVRGEPGFVAEPAVLRALEHLGDAAGGDPSVRHVMSIADLVKLVHRAFNDGRADHHVIPDDRGLIARYLALAYSPGFRRFVDRPLRTAAVWVTLDGATARDLARARRRLEQALAERPVPGATVDRYGGDGALTLAMAASGARIALGAAFVLTGCVLGAWLAAGAGGAWRIVVAGLAATLALAGVLGWTGQAIDLITVPLLAAAGLAAALLAAARARGPNGTQSPKG